jgi:hypothetical protein
VQAARVEMLAHPQVQGLIAEVATWPGYALKRHNDAGHPIYKFSTLADFGLRADDPGLAAGIEAMLAHQSPEGAFQSLVNVPKAFGGTGEDMWTWMLCDAPTLLYALLAMGPSTLPFDPSTGLRTSSAQDRLRTGLGQDELCPGPFDYAQDAPAEGRVQRAVEHLVGLVDENGWRCVTAPELGKFRGPGPGRRERLAVCRRTGVRQIQGAGPQGRPLPRR